MPSIRLHPQHGLNPTMPICFWCGEETGEIALLGAAYKKEAPRRMVLNHDPCTRCSEQMALGICIMECGGTMNHPEPTGSWVVITEDAARRLLTADMLERTLLARKAYMEPTAFRRLFDPSADVS
jgi:hypothetical protein